MYYTCDKCVTGGGAMQSFTITQKILAIGDTYEVRPTGSDEIYNMVKGKVMTLKPRLEMRQGMDGDVTHTLTGNFWKTDFSIIDSGGTEVGLVKYPFVAFFQRFVLITGGRTYNAKGGISAWQFSCTDESGTAVLEISKEFAFRDRFTVQVDDSIQKEVAILTAISVDQRFFQQQ